MLEHCWLCLNTVAHCATSSQVPAAGDHDGRDKIQDSQSISAPSNRAEVSRYKYKNKYVSWHCAHSDFEHGGGGRQCVDHMGSEYVSREKKFTMVNFFIFVQKNVSTIRFQEIKIRP